VQRSRIRRQPAGLPAALAPLAAEAIDLAEGAGRLLMRRFRSGVAVREKGPADIVTVADLEAQRFIAGRIRARFPDHGILGEESLDHAAEAETRWVVDPLDGTKNFAHGHPVFCVSIAVLRRGRVVVGAVHDPVHEELFLGVRGAGAWCNGRPIRVSTVSRLSRAFLGTGMPHRVRLFSASLGRTFGRFGAASQGVRDRGAGALDLCFVACGRLDGYWELDQSPWDVAAGSLILHEAGGRLSDFRGAPFEIFGGQNLASNGRIHGEMLRILALPGGYPKRYVPPLRRRKGARP